MTSKDDKEAKEKIRNMFQVFSSDIVKSIFGALDLLLSRCNSFEDFKIGMKQTVDNLIEEEKENDKL